MKTVLVAIAIIITLAVGCIPLAPKQAAKTPVENIIVTPEVSGNTTIPIPEVPQDTSSNTTIIVPDVPEYTANQTVVVENIPQTPTYYGNYWYQPYYPIPVPPAPKPIYDAWSAIINTGVNE